MFGFKRRAPKSTTPDEELTIEQLEARVKSVREEVVVAAKKAGNLKQLTDDMLTRLATQKDESKETL